ncbi:MAG TPA: redox-regulated ATPase YchF [bacterium (Candidatus Stahlbacteria)]|nr:redox-regulated ATPase YchF [Candidatus Stahlbacteria bacterium]
MKLGISGLPNAGKTSLFNLLTRAGAEIGSYPFTTIERNLGMTWIPDERFELLTATLKPKHKTRAQIEIIDIAGLVEGASRGEGLGNQFLANIRDVDLIIHLLRNFRATAVAHPYATIDPKRDYEVIRAEFLLSDLEIIQRRIKKLTKTGGPELDFLKTVISYLERGEVPPRAEHLKGYGLISTKPELIVLNCDEVKEKLKIPGYPISIRIEEEMEDMDEAEKRAFRKEYGLDPRGPVGIINEAIKNLDMISFYTIKGDESRAWIIKRGTRMIDAAGMIHTDLKRGFIRAEVAKVEDIVTLGGFGGAHEEGKVRIEGKDYEVQDGDVILIRFKV